MKNNIVAIKKSKAEVEDKFTLSSDHFPCIFLNFF